MELPLLMLQELFLHLPASCIIAAHRREAAGTLPCSRSRHGWQYIATKLACTRTRTSSNQSYTHLLARMYQSNNLAVKTYTFYITRLLFLGSCWGRGRERVCVLQFWETVEGREGVGLVFILGIFPCCSSHLTTFQIITFRCAANACLFPYVCQC